MQNASSKQLSYLLSLANRLYGKQARYFSELKGELGLNQRQARGRMTVVEASALIDELSDELDAKEKQAKAEEKAAAERAAGAAARLAALAEHRAATQFKPLDPSSPTARVHVALPISVRDAVDAAAEREGVSRAEWIRTAITTALASD